MRIPIFFLPILMMSATTAGCADRLKTQIEKPVWLACKRDAQCVTTYLSCHGWVAVASGHEADVQRWYVHENNKALSVMDCAGSVDVPRPAAVCRADVCTIGTVLSRP
ncbi:MAG: hypothetical protein HOP03_12275 [Lysobacter sp.]|nr:hypothetical protein [Lysobacter sp.]